MRIIKFELFMIDKLNLMYSIRDWQQWLSDMLMTPVRLCSVAIEHSDVDFENASLQEIDTLFSDFE